MGQILHGSARLLVEDAGILIIVLTFNESCPDLRNTRVVDIVRELSEYNVLFDIFEPWVDAVEARHEYGLDAIVETLRGGARQFRHLGAEKIRFLGKPDHVIYDLKYVLRPEETDMRQ